MNRPQLRSNLLQAAQPALRTSELGLASTRHCIRFSAVPAITAGQATSKPASGVLVARAHTGSALQSEP
jgi:hypothetical protein